MERMNYFALFGVIFFNLVVFSGFALTIAGLLFSLWTIVVSFILSPFILLVVNQLGIQKFELLQTILSCILFIIGIRLAPLAMKATRYLGVLLNKYIELNKRAVYVK